MWLQTIIMIVRLIKNKKYPMSVNCISAYFYGLTHLKIWFYILMYQDGKKNQESNFFIPTCLTENLAQSEVPQRPFSFGSWITKQREGNPSTEKKRTTNKPFYPNPIFIVISFFPRAMDKKIISRLKSNGRNITVEVGYITCQGLPGARRKEMQTLSMRTQQILFL